MTYKPKILVHCLFFVLFLLATFGLASGPVAGEQWQNPFASGQKEPGSSADSLDLVQVLGLVAKANPTLKAGLKQIEAANGLLIQSGLWSNPELELEFEEVGWDAPGFQESEITVMLSQEIELWGNRKNRKEVSRREMEVVQLETQIAAFDIYATTTGRYFLLSHAQRRVKLAQEAVDLAADIAASARIWVDMGAAMQSELLLGQLEMETAALGLADAISEMDIAKRELVSLWQGETPTIVIGATSLAPGIVSQIDALQPLLGGSREVRSLEAEAALAEAELDLEKSGAKPNLSLSGGFKRIRADGSNSFVFGVGLPLPFLNRNQGSIKSLIAGKEALRLSQQQALETARTEFQSSRSRVEQQLSRYRMIETRVLPKAEEAYLSLKSAYDKGRLPYSTLLEAQRTLISLRMELNDTDLTIKQEVVSLERLLGVTIQ